MNRTVSERVRKREQAENRTKTQAYNEIGETELEI
jgi:hypothetical protein